MRELANICTFKYFACLLSPIATVVDAISCQRNVSLRAKLLRQVELEPTPTVRRINQLFLSFSIPHSVFLLSKTKTRTFLLIITTYTYRS